MIRLLSILTIILAIILFPPATLAVISNNAVPGDPTYSIKRGLEDVIFAIASLNSATKAWFSAARSDRRFKELNVLITQGKQAKETLTELVEQTSVAAVQIAQIQDPGQKQQLVEEYTQTIEKYNQGLQELAQGSKAAPEVATQPTQQPTLTFTTTPKPTVRPTIVPNTKPSATPTSTVKPSERLTTRTPIPSSTAFPVPTPTQPSSGSDQRDIKDAIDKLNKIKDKLHSSNLTPKANTDKMEKKGNEGVPTPESDAKSIPAGSVKTKNEKQ